MSVDYSSLPNRNKKKRSMVIAPSKLELRKELHRRTTFSFPIGVVSGAISFAVKRNIIISLVFLAATILLILLGTYFTEKLSKSARIKKMEGVFPDFLQLMSSNLRAGITIDRSMLMSARSEFAPLDSEILKTGRDITTGKKIEQALQDMSKSIGSEKIAKTIYLIISGIRAGGDLATLLEDTAVNMREKSFMEKKAASNVLMYVIFIFVAVSVGAPALFGLSNILVETLTTLLSSLPENSQAPSMAFTLSSVNISIEFIFYFSIVFIAAINIMASLILGLVSKGEEREGLRYLPALLALSYTVFFIIKYTLSGVVSGFFK